MKKTDLALVIFIAGASVLIAFFVARAVIGDPGHMSETVKTATPITSSIIEPSEEIFNSEALNPTVEVCIGGACEEAPIDNNTGNGTETGNNTDNNTNTGNGTTNSGNGSTNNNNNGNVVTP